MSCNIIRDGSTKEVVTVFDENGQESNLFKRAVNFFKDKEQALNVWATSLTNDFKKSGKPATFKNVMNFLRVKATRKDKLTNEDKVSLANNVLTTGMNAETLFGVVSSTFYPEGYFDISEKRLKDSGLYTDSEIANLLNDNDIQNSVKDFTERLVSFYSNNEDISELDFIPMNNKDDVTTVINSTKVVGIGKYEQLNPNMVNRVLNERLAGIKDRDDFDAVVTQLPFESIVNRYNNDELFADTFYNKYSNTRRVSNFVIEDGELTLKTNTTNDFTDIKQTVRVRQENLVVGNVIDLIESTDITFWDRQEDAIKDALEEIEENLIDANLDVIGLSNMYDTHTREEVLDVLYNVEYISNRLKEGTATIEDLRDFTATRQRITNEPNKVDRIYLQNDGIIDNKTIIAIENPLTELEMFERFGMIKVRDNIYQKVERKPLDSLIADVIESIVNGEPLVNNEMFYPTAFNSNEEFDMKRFEKNKDNVELYKDARRYLTRKAFVSSESIDGVVPLDLVLFKEVYDYSPNKKAPNTDLFRGYTGNTQYLLTDFIADFKEAYLQEKYKQSGLFENVYSNFKIDARGITLTNEGVDNVEYLKRVLPNNAVFNNLKQYAYLSKDPVMQQLRPVTEDNLERRNPRDFYINYPNELPVFEGEYDFVDGFLVTDNVQEDFLRTPDGLFEKIDTKGNASIFRKLPTYNNSVYNVLNSVADYKGGAKLENFNKKSEKSSIFVKNLNKYNQAESEKIDSEIDGCK